MSAVEHGDKGEKGDHGIAGRSSIFKRAVIIWIVIFSAVVCFTLYKVEHTTSALKTSQTQGRKQRKAQDRALVHSQLIGCERGNLRFKTLLDLVAKTTAKVTAKKDGNSFTTDLATVTKALAPYYRIEHVDCKKAIHAKKASLPISTAKGT